MTYKFFLAIIGFCSDICSFCSDTLFVRDDIQRYSDMFRPLIFLFEMICKLVLHITIAYNNDLFAVMLINIWYLKNILSKHSQVRSYFEDLSTRNPFLKSKFNLDTRFGIYNFFFGI
jgi:hypothetical protein